MVICVFNIPIIYMIIDYTYDHIYIYIYIYIHILYDTHDYNIYNIHGFPNCGTDDRKAFIFTMCFDHGIHLFVQTLDKHWIKTKIGTLIILMMSLIGGSTLWRSNCFFSLSCFRETKSLCFFCI